MATNDVTAQVGSVLSANVSWLKLIGKEEVKEMC